MAEPLANQLGCFRLRPSTGSTPALNFDLNVPDYHGKSVGVGRVLTRTE